jgi:DNA-directed RNA polymerase specialized sigma subunit
VVTKLFKNIWISPIVKNRAEKKRKSCSHEEYIRPSKIIPNALSRSMREQENNMYSNIEEIFREPVRSRIEEIAEEQNMSLEEFVEYVVRRYIEDFHGMDSDEDAEDESTEEESDEA